ncbi:TetR/AcrR family transcriptional regulator [Phaeobacter sp. B1627]|uniref:TetR/AcrR family transcriptional regulator n=1 Tax=Phaeobacter sp. B1627 TaxID=2583809 RepID=UPI00111B50D7|nr:TetR/AcrR family transcriptional regulator [Phaeobacter sp. B1627]TNJ47509.1 TetR/AcrR family transcriptional regulator [Phaeobacter sp. B1627]
MSESASQHGTTRRQLIRSARRLFAAHGYAGASIAAISQDLGLTKQALLHHFGSKDRLYALAVEQTAREILQILFDAMEEGRPPEDQVEAFFAALFSHLFDDATSAQLLYRELTDQALKPQERAGSSLETVLESLVATVQATEKWQEAGVQGALAVVVQLLGAATLHFTAQGTLQRMFGRTTYQGACDQFSDVFADLVSRTLRD